MTQTEPRTETKNELNTIEHCRQLYSRARNRKRNLYEGWQRNYKLVHNKYTGTGMSSSQPTPRDSEIFPVLSAIIAWMTDQHTNVNIKPAVDPTSHYAALWTSAASDLQTVIQSNWINFNSVAQIKLALWDAFTFGPSYFKTVWDESLDKGEGNTRFIRVDPWCLYIDPNATSIYDAEYIVEARKMSLNEVQRRWPDKAVLVDASGGLSDAMDSRPTFDGQRPTRGPMANPGPLPGGTANYGKPSSSPPSYPDGGEVVVYEYWMKRNHSYVEKVPDDKVGTQDLTFAEAEWRCVVIANNTVLMDEKAEDLWAYASHPYDSFIAEDFGELYGIPITDHLAQPQVYINRLLGALQQNAELTGNPVFIEADNSGLERTPIINRPGQRLKLRGAGAMQNKPDWLSPPPMPQVVMDMVQFWISRIENISGLGAAIKGGVNGAPSRTPEGVISTIQEASFVRIRSMLGNLEACLMSIAKKQADLIIENYTQERVVAIVGPTGTQTALVLKKNHFNVPSAKGKTPLKYALIVQAGASMPTSRQARVAEADQAFAMGVIDRQAWFEAHEYPDWPEVLKRVNDQIAQGVFTPPGARQRTGRTS